MASYGVHVQQGDVASSVKEARDVAARLIGEDAEDLVVKAQILAGGRGKGRFNTGFKGTAIIRLPSIRSVQAASSCATRPIRLPMSASRCSVRA
jgi:succinyl-CoA synthetase beta subunit